MNSRARFRLRKRGGLWTLTDRRRPSFRGRYETLELAARAMDNIIRRELGLLERGPLPREIIRAGVTR